MSVDTVFEASLADHLGSATTSRQTDGVTVTQRYTPFGAIRGGGGNQMAADLTFTGQTDDPGTGLIDYNARAYDPMLGRFIMADPVLDGLNRYTYVKNNPVRFTDPTGNVCITSGPRAGQCYEGADGEEWAMSLQEELMGVRIVGGEGANPDGSPRPPRNLRFSGPIADMTTEEIVSLWRSFGDDVTEEQRIATLVASSVPVPGSDLLSYAYDATLKVSGPAKLAGARIASSVRSKGLITWFGGAATVLSFRAALNESLEEYAHIDNGYLRWSVAATRAGASTAAASSLGAAGCKAAFGVAGPGGCFVGASVGALAGAWATNTVFDGVYDGVGAARDWAVAEAGSRLPTGRPY